MTFGPDRAPNVALLIDADNAAPQNLERVLGILADLGMVNIRRAYGNWRKQALKGWADLVQDHALEAQQQFDVSKGKNATDMRMVIDALDLLHSGRVQGFGLMSSDSDFAPLVIRLRQDGVPVYGFGTDTAPPAFRNACTRFINLTAPAEGPAAASRQQVTDEVIKVLGDAIVASKRDANGFASLAEVGSRAGSLSSFDVRSFGFTRLSDMLESLPQFKVERREGNASYVKRLR